MEVDLPFSRLPLIECGDWLLVDATSTRLSALTQRVVIPDSSRTGFATAFEAQLHERLSPLGRQPFGPGKKTEGPTEARSRTWMRA